MSEQSGEEASVQLLSLSASSSHSPWSVRPRSPCLQSEGLAGWVGIQPDGPRKRRTPGQVPWLLLWSRPLLCNSLCTVTFVPRVSPAARVSL